MTTSLDNRIPPPVLALATGACMALAAGASGPPVIASTLRMIGIVLAVGSAARFGLPAFTAFRRAGTTINPIAIDRASVLVTSGIYRRSRNPMYVALTSLLVALAFGLGNPWTLAGPALFALYLRQFQILPEERVMAAKFGPAYADYCRTVRRWI